MAADEFSYDQPVKNEVRVRVLAHAVQSLTSERHLSPIVTAAEFDHTLEYCCG